MIPLDKFVNDFVRLLIGAVVLLVAVISLGVYAWNLRSQLAVANAGWDSCYSMREALVDKHNGETDNLKDELKSSQADVAKLGPLVQKLEDELQGCEARPVPTPVPGGACFYGAEKEDLLRYMEALQMCLQGVESLKTTLGENRARH